MNTFSKKSLHVALAGLGVLSLAGTADAVMVKPVSQSRFPANREKNRDLLRN